MKLIVGLGNVGKGYDKTYHNMGFWIVDRLAKKLNIDFDTKKCKSLIAKVSYEGEEVVIAKPTTFMNLSGQAVIELCKKYKVNKKDILIVLDDITLEVGKIRYRESGSAGTHKGLRNIIDVLDTTDISRIRIGVGKDASMDLADYVVSKIEPHKFEQLKPLVDEAVDMVLERIVQKDKQ